MKSISIGFNGNDLAKRRILQLQRLHIHQTYKLATCFLNWKSQG